MCAQIAIYPGKEGLPFVDFREEIDRLPPHRRSDVIGKAALALVDNHVLRWPDVVNRDRVKPLHELVAKHSLTVERMIQAGVSRREAQRAYDRAHGHDAEALAEAHRRAQEEAIAAKAEAQRQVKEAARRRLAEREAKVEARPKKPEVAPAEAGSAKVLADYLRKGNVKISAIEKVVAGHFGKINAEVEARRLRVAEAAKKAKARPKKVAKVIPTPPPLPVSPPVPEVKPPPTFTGPVLPGRPIAERIAGWEEGRRKLDAIRAIRGEVERAEEEARAKRTEFREAERRIKKAEWDSTDPKVVAKVARVRALEAEYKAAHAAATEVRLGTVRRTLDLIAVPESGRIAVTDRGIEALDTSLDPELGVRAARTRDQLATVLRGVESERLDLIWKLLPEVNGRCFHNGSVDDAGVRFSRLKFTAGADAGTIAHEAGHAIEWQVPGVHEAVRAFLEHRVGRETPRPMRVVSPMPGGAPKFGADEMGRKDHFDRYFTEGSAYYVGKPEFSENSEVLSMGLTALFDDPVRFAESDPEFCTFVLGLLSGELRHL
jgi:hypothetical protein